MVETIQRDKNDLFYYSWGERFFKNPKTLFVVRSIALGLFVYALVYGFIHPQSSDNHFTTAIFWSFFWPFFYVSFTSDTWSLFLFCVPTGVCREKAYP